MPTHTPDPDDDLVYVADRAELRGQTGFRHLTRKRRAGVEGQNWAHPGGNSTARCGASCWLAGSTEPPPTGDCNSCFRDIPEDQR
ncbi:MAG TPA: hypothetical protein VMW08_00760 [Acidimicrobiales bacterium]|nr:hypothetical protein [Acidimicrobiales bacterium]